MIPEPTKKTIEGRLDEVDLTLPEIIGEFKNQGYEIKYYENKRELMDFETFLWGIKHEPTRFYVGLTKQGQTENIPVKYS